MKKIILKTLGAVVAVLALVPVVSCSDSDSGVKNYEMNLSLTMPEGINASDIEDLIFVATKGTVSDTIKINAGEIANLTLPQGQYSYVVSGKVKDDLTRRVIGTGTVDLFKAQTINLPLEISYESPLIFKAIYSSGGKAGYVMDSYFEIVNNSDEVQYLDGLIISSPQGNQEHENGWQAAGITDLYASGQGTVVAFPGKSGEKQYPIQPGESVVVANDAANHHDLAGDGNNCPDLSGADWEIYISNVTGEVDYPAPNLSVIFQNNAYMKAFGLGFFGRAYILAKLPDGVSPEEFAADPANLQTTPNTTSTMQYLMIPSKYVLDAVDIWDPDSETHYSTFLPKDDAQGVLASDTWAGKMIRRKLSKQVGTRYYYQDTNNSSNDFLRNQPVVPGWQPTVAE